MLLINYFFLSPLLDSAQNIQVWGVFLVWFLSALFCVYALHTLNFLIIHRDLKKPWYLSLLQKIQNEPLQKQDVDEEHRNPELRLNTHHHFITLFFPLTNYLQLSIVKKKSRKTNRKQTKNTCTETLLIRAETHSIQGCSLMLSTQEEQFS